MLPLLALAQSSQTSLVVAEQMPYFEGCEDYEDGSEEKRNCSNINLVNFISENIQYPEDANTKGIEGTVFLSFVVDKDGKIHSQEVLRDIGGGCAKEALRILNLMPTWQAAVNDGKTVSVKLNLPITFSLKNTANSILDNFQIHWGGLKGKTLTQKELNNSLSENLFVRNEFGDTVDISGLTFIFQRNRTYIEETSTGKINDSLSKVVKKTKKGGLFTIVATIMVDGEFLEIERNFNII